MVPLPAADTNDARKDPAQGAEGGGPGVRRA